MTVSDLAYFYIFWSVYGTDQLCKIFWPDDSYFRKYPPFCFSENHNFSENCKFPWTFSGNNLNSQHRHIVFICVCLSMQLLELIKQKFSMCLYGRKKISWFKTRKIFSEISFLNAFMETRQHRHMRILMLFDPLQSPLIGNKKKMVCP